MPGVSTAPAPTPDGPVATAKATSYLARFKPQAVPTARSQQERERSRQAVVSADGLTRAEVARHTSPEDMWMIVEDKVYDVTDFVQRHPGGDIITSHAGADASGVFQAFHGAAATKLLPKYYIGDLHEGEETSVVLRELRELKRDLTAQGLFKASATYYTGKVVLQFSYAIASALLLTYSTEMWALLTSAFLMALCWQQAGWLSHDFIHHQVFTNRWWGDMFGLLLGNFLQGFSTSWWKAKHNLHHAVPNVKHGDPDIDTMPFLLWSEKLLEGELDGLPQTMVRYQGLLYWPLLFAARLNWAVQSILYVNMYRGTGKVRHESLEILALALHWTWTLAIPALLLPTWSQRILWFVLSEGWCGLMLGAVFALNHNGMPIIDVDGVQTLDFASIQAITTRNVTPSAIVTYITGGLNFQIEHHLFPTLPRHSFHKASPAIQAFLRKHNIPYHCTTFWQGTVELYGNLLQVARGITRSAGKRTAASGQQADPSSR